MNCRSLAGSDSALHLALCALLLLVLCNLAFNAAMAGLGFDVRYTSFLGYWHDAFADYFKFILSYPGGTRIELGGDYGLAELVRSYTLNNPYKGVDGLSEGSLTHLHVTPITTAYSLINLHIMRVVDPQLLFVVQVTALFCHAWHIVRREATDRHAALRLFAIFAVSYPTLTMLTRGNLFAGFAALSLIDAMTCAVRGRSMGRSAILLAIAINVRPNAIVFLVPFLILFRHRWQAALLSVGIAGSVLGVASLAASHLLYPGYNVTTFLAGLRVYYAFYAVGGMGWPYGSSLFGGLAMIFGYSPNLATIATGCASVLYGWSLILFLRGRLDPPSLLFATCAAYALASTVFADYHLMAFQMVPIAILARQSDRQGNATRWPLNGNQMVALTCTVLILAPKNYLFSGELSWQVVLNPAILVIGTACLIWRNLVRTERGEAILQAPHLPVLQRRS